MNNSETEGLHYIKWLRVERLIELLQQLPPGSNIMPNETTRNLSILDQDLGCIGQVDFLHDGEVEMWEDDTLETDVP